MARTFVLIVLVIQSLFAVSSLGQSPNVPENISKEYPKPCGPNVDKRYERELVISEFDQLLRSSIPAYAQFRGDGFFIFDLNDLHNRYIPLQFRLAQPCIEFVEGHIYHFAPISFSISESHIAILSKGEKMFFKSVNCPKGDNINDVLSQVDKVLDGDKTRNEVLRRVKEFRKYGFYVSTDEKTPLCH